MNKCILLVGVYFRHLPDIFHVFRKEFSIPIGLPVKLSATKQYSAAQVQLFKRVLHAVPITLDGANPFAAVEFFHPLPFCERLLKEDETRIVLKYEQNFS